MIGIDARMWSHVNEIDNNGQSNVGVGAGEMVGGERSASATSSLVRKGASQYQSNSMSQPLSLHEENSQSHCPA